MISYSGGTVDASENQTPKKHINTGGCLILHLLHAALLVGVRERFAKVLVEALLCRLVTVRRILWQVLLGRIVASLASVEVVDLTILRIVVLGSLVAVSLTLLVMTTSHVSAVEGLIEVVRTHLLPLIFFTA